MSDTNLAALLGITDSEEQTERAEVTPIWYRHKKIRNFATGEGKSRFEFENFLLCITGATQEEVDAKNQEFLRLAAGLMMVDKLNIVLIKNIQNEFSLDEARVVRGTVGTNSIADKPIGDAPAAAKDPLAEYAPQSTPAPAKAGLSFIKQAGT